MKMDMVCTHSFLQENADENKNPYIKLECFKIQIDVGKNYSMLRDNVGSTSGPSHSIISVQNNHIISKLLMW